MGVETSDDYSINSSGLSEMGHKCWRCSSFFVCWLEYHSYQSYCKQWNMGLSLHSLFMSSYLEREKYEGKKIKWIRDVDKHTQWWFILIWDDTELNMIERERLGGEWGLTKIRYLSALGRL
ncbi:hypothetical protein HS088_TW04G00037 [Tripterygium wilfordii]|uniref:Uncharacterized protein n=1 Tax=Tripterygium wilfordii TaxID=458696 RepID=A0A7J7DP10_TRIWF|nr:hypothetical protein HS088_TW04G00037 [Tripterygium wilfordii]